MAINLLKMRLQTSVAPAYSPSPQARDSPSMHLVFPVLQTRSMGSGGPDSTLLSMDYFAAGSRSCHLIRSQFFQFPSKDEEMRSH